MIDENLHQPLSLWSSGSAPRFSFVWSGTCPYLLTKDQDLITLSLSSPEHNNPPLKKGEKMSGGLVLALGRTSATHLLRARNFLLACIRQGPEAQILE